MMDDEWWPKMTIIHFGECSTTWMMDDEWWPRMTIIHFGECSNMHLISPYVPIRFLLILFSVDGPLFQEVLNIIKWEKTQF